VQVSVPQRPPEVAVLHPTDGQTLVAGGTMRLWAAVSAADGGPLEEASYAWILDGEPFADGDDAWAKAPPPGEHGLTLRVRSAGGEAESTVRFSTVDVPTEGQSAGE
jgi:hypothetical protein